MITDLAVFDFDGNGMVLVELQDGVTLDEVVAKTEASFKVGLELVQG